MKSSFLRILVLTGVSIFSMSVALAADKPADKAAEPAVKKSDSGICHDKSSPSFANTKKLSKVVLNNFKPMIPEQFHGIWQEGIDSNDYYLKLCGSGGGGYILGFTQNLEKARISLKDYKLEVVYQF